uniref:Uncharacterized protein n=1 Tax=Micrurus lemniscatus lemniscatus TaxID=129467 RepID=A0A2D4H6C1_MICLE
MSFHSTGLGLTWSVVEDVTRVSELPLINPMMDLMTWQEQILASLQNADGLSDKSSLSGPEGQNFAKAFHTNSELEDMEGKTKKPKKTEEKLKTKEKNKKPNLKNKLKISEKDKKEENENPERKTKKKSLGAMLRVS